MNTRNPLNNFDNFVQSMHNELARSFVGFDNIFDDIRNTISAYDSYPPYNVEKLTDTEYLITLALAGFNKDDIEVSKDEDILTISGKIKEIQGDNDQNYLHKGIANRAFTRKVKIASNIEILGAKMNNGLLSIALKERSPEKKTPTSIKIN